MQSGGRPGSCFVRANLVLYSFATFFFFYTHCAVFYFCSRFEQAPKFKKKMFLDPRFCLFSPSPLCILPSLREHKHYLLVIIICGKVTRRDCFFPPRSLQSNKLLYRRLLQRKLLCVSLFPESRMLRRKTKRSRVPQSAVALLVCRFVNLTPITVPLTA